LEVPWGSEARYMYGGPGCKDFLGRDSGIHDRMSLICNG
jgi:hypothetical protein